VGSRTSLAGKRRIDDLALFGGPPAFPETLHVGRPNIGSSTALVSHLRKMLRRRWLTNYGPVVQQFERRIAELVGVDHCVAVCNATLGLQVVGKALALVGEVVVPAFTFVATPHAFRWVGIEPVFCDVDLTSHNLDPADVSACLSSRTAAIVGLHCWGQPCPVPELEELARRRSVPLIFDAAHAFGCQLGRRPVGSFGNAEVFSFHATKFVNSFEGGAITTSDPHLARELRLLINFGFRGYDDVATLGTNAKMSEIHAAMGLVSLDYMERIVLHNRRNYAAYRRSLAHLPGIQVRELFSSGHGNYQYVVVELDPLHCPLSRDSLLAILHAEGVLARRYFSPGCHRMEPYVSRVTPPPRPLPNTDLLVQRVLQLPTGTAVSLIDIARIAELIAFALDHGEEIRARLGAEQRLS